MSAYNPRVGEVFVNRYGLTEVKRTATKTRMKLARIDELDRIWLANPHGALVPDGRTTHLRITCARVEPHGVWSITAGSHIIDIDNSYAGERFDLIVPLVQGAMVATTLHGMQREGAAQVWVQELVIEEE